MARGVSKSHPRGLIAVAVVATWVTTGGNFIAFKQALKGLPPMTLMSVRLLLAAVALGLLALLRHAARPTLAQMKNAAVAGLLLLALGQGAIVWGIQDLPSGQTALLASSAPLFIAIFSIARGERPQRRDLIGICLGLLGLGLMTFAGGSDQAFNLLAAGIVLAGSDAWACGSMYVASCDLPRDPVTSGAMQMFAASLIAIPIALARSEVAQLRAADLSVAVVLSTVYLGLVGLAIGYSVFSWLDRTANPIVANTFQYVSPVIALVAGATLLGERVTAIDVTAGAILIGSVALLVTRGAEGRSSTGEEAQP